ncbi:ComEA family DNA-binding protein [Bifidobacterium sp.]|jgi:competence protein ComEA|nr:helix-hairpin-helix domain-containing protein [Bifidobacterium sp.]MCI1224288.1 helix-hairpin-helix domain-containing protein [Bifidobacterium sp.]
MPRLVSEPWYAVVVMFILGTALCASMTMLIRQSINYHAASAQQLNSSDVSSVGGNASDNPSSNSSADESKSNAPEETQIPQHTATAPADGPTASLVTPSNPAAKDSGLVNLNTATMQELDTISGVGPVTAQRILEHRQRIGRFTSIDQLLDISGIGPKTLEKLRSQVTVS